MMTDTTTTDQLATITRPNGTIYRPRKLRAMVWGNNDEGPTGIVVFGTEDVATARALAQQAADNYNEEWGGNLGPWLVVADDEPVPAWIKRQFRGYEDDQPQYFYGDDLETGAYSLRFAAHETDKEPKP